MEEKEDEKVWSEREEKRHHKRWRKNSVLSLEIGKEKGLKC